MNGILDTITGGLGNALNGAGNLIGDGLNTINQQVGKTLGSPLVTPDQINDATLGQSKYDFSYRVFPSNIGKESYFGHYMVININVSNYSNMATVSKGGATVTNFTRLSGEVSKVDALRATIDQQYTGNGQTLGPGKSFIPRQTTRIAESIALFMPNNAVFTDANDYEDVRLSDIVGEVPAISSVYGFAQKATALAQAPINPRIEVIFSSTSLRTFAFDFLCAPVNETESKTLEEIIRTLRFHSRPEVNSFFQSSIAGDLKGFLWLPPSEFDITFYQDGAENTHIPRINTCVLEQIDVDYAPTGVWATFKNGYPVKTRIQMRFKEVEVNHRLRIQQGF